MQLLALKACAKLKSDDDDDDVLAEGLGIIDAHVWEKKVSKNMAATLIAFYGRFGRIEQAQRVFEALCAGVDIVNSMMNAMCDTQRNAESLNLFRRD